MFKIGITASLFALAVAMLYVMSVSNSNMAAVQAQHAESIRLLDRKIKEAEGRDVARTIALREKMNKEFAVSSKQSADRDIELAARSSAIEQAAKQTNWNLLSLSERLNALIAAKEIDLRASIEKLASEQTTSREQCDAEIQKAKEELATLLRDTVVSFSERDARAFLESIRSVFVLRITKTRTVELPKLFPMLFWREVTQVLQWKAIGVIVKEGDHIYPLTSLHVFFPSSVPDGFEFAKVEMQTFGREFEEAELRGFSPIHDLACADFKEAHAPDAYGVPATLATDDPLAPGERVMTIGLYNDLAIPSYGEIESNEIDEFGAFGWNPGLILTDAKQVPGFSGGPLFSIIAERPLTVVGINGRGRMFGNVAMPYSLSYVDIKALLPRIKNPGKIQYGNPGITIKFNHGVVAVDAVDPGGAAAGKLMTGDIVLSVNGHGVSSVGEVVRWIVLEPPGATVTFRVHRLPDTDLDVEVTLGPES